MEKNVYTGEEWFQGLCSNDTVFRSKLYLLLKMARLREDCITEVLKQQDLFVSAFTHSSWDPQQNYEWFELLGDAVLNKSIVWYITKKFPQLHNPEGVKVIARLKINLVSKKNFVDLSQRLGLPEYIRVDRTALSHATSSRLTYFSIVEDVLEALFGCLEYVLDNKYGEGSGLCICYSLLECVMNTKVISIRYEDLYDPITRLKETFDCFHSVLGSMRFQQTREDGIHHVRIFSSAVPRLPCLGQGRSNLLDDAKTQAALEALTYLDQRMNIRKKIPEYYTRLSSSIEADGIQRPCSDKKSI